jgi:heme/copper-type cytochrome/quinol oxidase subunit 3
MKERRVVDVTTLPTWGFGPVMTMWWGTAGFMLLEGTGFALAGATYLYLRFQNREWPLDAAAPGLLWSSLLTALLVLSAIPNVLAKKAAERQDLRKVRLWLVVMCLIGIVAVGLRAMEYTTLNVRWDQNAYGSALWFLLSLHTTHIATDLGDTLVLTALMFTKHGQGKRFSDVAENADYWHFVWLSWLPIYLLLYWAPRI